MSSLLHIEVSPWTENSVSRSVSAEYVASLNAIHSEGTVVFRDLDKTLVPHLDLEAIEAGYMAESERSQPMVTKWGARIHLVEEISSVGEVLI